MELVPGGKDPRQELHEGHLARGRGELRDIVAATESQSGRTVAGLLEQLNIEDHYQHRVEESLARAAYRIGQGESIATDLDLNFQGNLADQLAELRGIDNVKVHLSVFEAMCKTPEAQGMDLDTLRHMTWTWEIGRYAGRTLQRHVDAHIAPLSIPGNLGILNFFEKVAVDLFGDRYDFSFPAYKDIKSAAIQDYRQNAFPERLASAFGNIFIQHFHDVDEDFTRSFGHQLRDAVVRPYNLAEDFGTDFRPEVSYYELAASHPLSDDELGKYLEYISEPSDTIYLHDR